MENSFKDSIKNSITLRKLASLTESTLIGDPDYRITFFAGLESAGARDVSFFSSALYSQKTRRAALEKTRAGAVFLAPDQPTLEGKNYLLHPSPALAFQKAVNLLYQEAEDASAYANVHKTAVIHETCVIEERVVIGPHTVIDREVSVAAGTKIGPNCYLGPHVRVGVNCVLHANVTIRERCVLQDRVWIQPGAVIGSCGFGYHTDAKGCHTHLKQLGIVVLEDDVEIGANTTIDRARFDETRIKRGTKIDNLVQIGHGVHVGEDNLIVSQTGIAGSTRTGKHVVLGGQVAVNGHIELTDGVIVTSRSGVSKSLTKPGKYGGVPAIALNEHNRNSVQLRRIDQLLKRVEALEKRLSEESIKYN